MSCFSVEHPHDFPFSHFIRYLWDLTNICGDSIGNYVSAVRTRLSLHSMSPIPECRYASALLTTLRAQPRDRAFRDPAPAALIAAAMADESTDLAFDEDYTLLRRDVILHEGWVGLRVRTFKTDKLNKGAVVWISPTGKPGCPVALFMRYWRASSHFEPSSPLFRRTHDGGIVTKRALATALQAHARALGIPDQFISSHSIRVGSASHLAAAQVSLQDIMFQGRWAQSESVMKYLRDALPRCQRILTALDLEPCFDAAGLPRPSPARMPPTVFHRRAESRGMPPPSK